MKDANNPYVGLRPFDVDESILFFGGNDQTLELLQRLHAHHFVAVVGSSGSGKSSLLRAGLIPSLKAGYLVEDSDRWMIAIMKPGQNPLYNLAAAVLQQIDPDTKPQAIASLVQKIKEEGSDALLSLLAPVAIAQNSNFFLLVDQFEELFRFAMEKKDVAQKDEATDFVNIMLELAQQKAISFYVVITMRSDFIGDCAQFFNLPEAMNQSQYLVPRLTRVQMKTVIEGPAKLYGGKINPALTSRLLNDLGRVKDELPLLQHALMRIWDFEVNVNKSGQLDLEDYERIGGIENALSNHADEALAGMNEADLLLTKKIFQALTAIDENGRKIRRPVLLSQLKALTGAGEEKLLKIIHLFNDDKRSFFVIDKAGDKDDTTIDISHESLIRQWKSLGKWVDEEGESTAAYFQLAEAAKLYQQKKKDYLTGSELQLALDWCNNFKPVAVWANRYKAGFDQCIQYLKDSEAERTAKQEAERKRKRSQRYLIYAVMALLVFLAIGAIGFSLYFNGIKKEAVKQKLATENQYNAFLLHAQREEKLDEDPTLALRLEESAYKKLHDSIFERTAYSVYSKNSFYKIIARHNNNIFAVAFSPDGKEILTGSSDHTARLWNTAGNLLQEFKGHADTVWTVGFSPDAKMIVTGSGDKTVRLWDRKGNTIRELKGHLDIIWAAGFSPDGTKILSGSEDKTAFLWDLDGNILRKLQGHNAAVYTIAFSPDGKTMLTGSGDNTAVLWDMKGKKQRVLAGHKKSVFAAIFSPDGKMILTGSQDKTGRLWDLNGHTLAELKTHSEAVSAVGFSPDGKTMLTGSWDKTACLWDLRGNILQQYKGHKDGVTAIAFSPDGGAMLTGSMDSTARLWTLKERTIQVFEGHSNLVSSVAYSPDGTKIATGSWDGNTLLRDLRGNLLHVFEGYAGSVTSVAFSPDGTKLIAGSGYGTVKVWRLNGNLLSTLGQSSVISSVAFSPDGTKIATGSYDGTAHLWSVEGDDLHTFKGHERTIWSVAFSPDGTKILTGSSDKTARLWYLNGDTAHTFRGHSDTVWAVAFSPDGTKVLTGSSDKTARLWDLKGALIQKFEGHGGQVTGVAFSPDGKTILTSASDKIARLWNLKGSIIQECRGHFDWLTSVAFSPDGKTVLTGSADSTARIWNVAMPLKDFLKSNAIEPLSAEQKKLYKIE